MMTQEMKVSTKHMLLVHEGYSKYPYTDTQGHITIGIGYNLTDRGIDDTWINKQCEEDMNWCFMKLFMNFDWYSELNDVRQMALVNMCYNLGWRKFLTFKKMIAALSKEDFNTAAFELLDSKWAKQVGKRADDIAHMIKTGDLPPTLRTPSTSP